MHISSEKFQRIAIGLVVGIAIILAAKFAEASASEGAVSQDSHSISNSIELGPSQKAACKQPRRDDGSDWRCARAARFLISMNAESRDKEWAGKMEANLNEWVESLASQGITSRDVECRLSWCLVEVGSTEGNLPDWDLGNASKWKLFKVLFLFAPDIDDPKVGDMVIFLKRYCKSVSGEILDHDGHLLPNAETAGHRC